MYAGNTLHYKEVIESFRAEDFRVAYNTSNRFRFMGNGFTLRDERGEGLAYYLKK